MQATLSTAFLKAKQDNMNSIERIQYLYLENDDGPRFPRYSTPTARIASPDTIHPHITHPVQRSDRRTSTASSASKYNGSGSSFARKESSSTTASSIVSIPPWHPLTFDQQMASTPYNYGYTLPCEFFFIGCELDFDPSQFEAWISHSASHLGVSLPQKAICTFCDGHDGVFASNGDALSNWWDRMCHIRNHLQHFAPSQRIRADYFVIEHMWVNGLISVEDYDHALEGTERPYCSDTYSLDFETPEMLQRKGKASRQQHDLGNEKRKMKKEAKEAKKGKSTHTPGSKHRPKVLQFSN